MVDLPKQVVISQEVLFQVLENEAIMLNLRDEYYYSLDDVGMRIWQLLAADSDVERVVQQLLAEYEVDEQSLRQDLAELIAELFAANMVTVMN